MPNDPRRKSQREAAARVLGALGRGADAGLAAARTLYGRWRNAPPVPRPALPAPVPAGAPVLNSAAAPTGGAARQAPPPAAGPPADSADMTEIEVRDLRAELARELERLAGADIAAGRRAGRAPDESNAPDGHVAGAPPEAPA